MARQIFNHLAEWLYSAKGRGSTTEARDGRNSLGWISVNRRRPAPTGRNSKAFAFWFAWM